MKKSVVATSACSSFSRQTAAPPLAIYRALRMLNPSPYMFFLRFSDDFSLIGASPEMMVRLEDGVATADAYRWFDEEQRRPLKDPQPRRVPAEATRRP